MRPQRLPFEQVPSEAAPDCARKEKECAYELQSQ